MKKIKQMFKEYIYTTYVSPVLHEIHMRFLEEEDEILKQSGGRVLTESECGELAAYARSDLILCDERRKANPIT